MAGAASLTETETSKYVHAGSLRIHYNEAGTGPAVIMLHGGGPGASGWSNFQRNIGPLSERFRVILIDFPGFGKSDSVVVNEPRSQVNARVLCDLLDALRIDKTHLIGNSMGGASGLNFAIDYPDRIDRLVIMGAAGAGQSLFVPMPTEGIKVLNQVFDNPTIEGMKRLIQLMVYDSSFLTEELLQQRLQDALNPQHMEARKKSKAVQMDLSRDLAKVKAKTLIIWGRDDRVVPLDGSLRLLWGIPDSELHVFGRCGHWAQFEHAEEFNRLVMGFLTR
ncbi:MAG: alpha/beta fold hydrolase [Deltaproteobacteria bacterium]|nr:alpha/beta fold hydrolase [Deltaproteobacteria bacterium]